MKTKGLKIAAVAAACMALLSGCGNSNGRRIEDDDASTLGTKRVHLTGTQTPSSTLSSVSSSSSSGLSGDSMGTLTSGTSGPSSTGTAPVYSFQIQGIGYTSQTVTVSAQKILRVRFTPGQQDRQVEGSGFSPPYSKLGVYIKVGSQSQATPMLRNGLSGDQQTSGVLDFSAAIRKSVCVGSAAVPSCREEVTITIERPNYDYWCFNYPYGVSMGSTFYSPYQYCPWTHVHSTHPWNGELTVQTDDTVSVN